jgi:hypothetical protein
MVEAGIQKKYDNDIRESPDAKNCNVISSFARAGMAYC